MLNKKKLTPYIWFDGEKFKVEKVISPNKYDDFILISRKRTGYIHEDGKTVSVEMYLIDCGNDYFYPDTVEVEKIMKKNTEEKDLEEKRERVLSNIWLSLLKDENNNLLS